MESGAVLRYPAPTLAGLLYVLNSIAATLPGSFFLLLSPRGITQNGGGGKSEWSGYFMRAWLGSYGLTIQEEW